METFFNVSEQTWLFLWACVIGVGLGIVYDFFRVFRILINHNQTAVFVEDVVYTFFFAMTLFVYSTERARGELRFFIFLGAFLGFVVYTLTVGYIIVSIIRRVVTFIYKILHAVYIRISVPVKKLVCTLVQKTKNKFVKFISTLKNNRKKKQKSLKQSSSIVYNNHNNKQISSNRDVKNNGRKNHRKKKAKKVRSIQV